MHSNFLYGLVMEIYCLTIFPHSFCLLFNVHVCSVYVRACLLLCAHMHIGDHAHICTCVYRPEGNAGYLPLLLTTLIFE